MKNLKYLNDVALILPDEEYSIPLNISDLLHVCKTYAQLNKEMQFQLQAITELGVDEAIRQGFVNKKSLSDLKLFFKDINANAYFGDAASQAEDALQAIKKYESREPQPLILDN